MIRCVIVDDEPRSVEIVKSFADRIPFLKIEAACTDSVEAFPLIQKISPDLLFLDIEMPDVSGIELAHKVTKPPYIIFITAYSRYAVEGFNLNAIDYLLKPYSFERFYESVKRAKQAIDLRTTMLDLPKDKSYIILKSEYQNIKVILDDIIYIEAMDKYVKVYVDDKKILSLMSLKSILELLPKDDFMRIHKSFVVSKNKISSFNRQHVYIETKSLPIGRSYVTDFLKQMLENNIGK